MNVLILTSSIIESDFAEYQEKAIIKPNPSNQNFYSKLIKTIAKNNNVSVVSLRPFSKGMFKEKSLAAEKFVCDGIPFRYSRVQTGRIYKTFVEFHDLYKQAEDAIKEFKSDDFIVVVDTLRFNLMKCALQIKKNYGVKIVGMLTDNPLNLTGVSAGYVGVLSAMVTECDGYLSLTNGLADFINKNKPRYVFEGLVEEPSTDKKTLLNDYFFFGGSLYERYGVKKLVDGYLMSNCKTKLIIAGSGPLESYIDAKTREDTRILLLPQLSKAKLLSYEMNAKANINPRPLDDKMDKESIPSKLVEYLSIGVPIISSKHPAFYSLFKNDLTWFNDSSLEDIAVTLEKFEKTDSIKEKEKALVAKKKAFEFYSLNIQSEAISHFLYTLKN